MRPFLDVLHRKVTLSESARYLHVMDRIAGNQPFAGVGMADILAQHEKTNRQMNSEQKSDKKVGLGLGFAFWSRHFVRSHGRAISCCSKNRPMEIRQESACLILCEAECLRPTRMLHVFGLFCRRAIFFKTPGGQCSLGRCDREGLKSEIYLCPSTIAGRPGNECSGYPRQRHRFVDQL